MSTKKIGPRVAKWQQEWDELLAKLPKLAPESEEFYNTWDRLVCGLGRHIDGERYFALKELVVSLVAPKLVRRAAAIQKRLGTSATIMLDALPMRDGWQTQTSVWFHRQESFFDTQDVNADVAAMLRREAEALTALADKIEK